MTYIPYLIKTVKTNKLSELVAVIDAPPLDMNLAVWDSIDAGEVEVDEDKDSITALKDAEPWQNEELANKLLRTIQHYSANKVNITRGRMNALLKEPITNLGYPMHEYFMSLQYLVDNGTVVEEIVDMPELIKQKVGKKGKKTRVVVRPAHKFVFLGLPGNDNEEWNAKAVSKWVDDMKLNEVK